MNDENKKPERAPMANNDEILREIQELRSERATTLRGLRDTLVNATRGKSTQRSLSDLEIETAVRKWMEENPDVKQVKFDVRGADLLFREIEPQVIDSAQVGWGVPNLETFDLKTVGPQSYAVFSTGVICIGT
jgi:hypothetical protein